MEALSRCLERAKRGNYISDFSVGSRYATPIMISHFLFEDDMLIFCGADLEQMWHFESLFVWFRYFWI